MSRPCTPETGRRSVNQVPASKREVLLCRSLCTEKIRTFVVNILLPRSIIHTSKLQIT